MNILKENITLVKIVSIMIGCLCIVSVAWSHGVDNSDHGRLEMPIEADDVYEHCFRLTPAQQLQYSFTTSEPVGFNLHYHIGGKIIYPVEEHQTASRTEVFQADSDQEYCLMWTNEDSTPVDFTLEYETRSAASRQ